LSKAGFERDQDVYVFATMYNDNIFSNNKLRKLFEEEHLAWAASDLSRMYLKNFERVRKQRPYLESFLSNEVRTEAVTTKDDSVDEKATARAVESGLLDSLRCLKATAVAFIKSRR
jgi:hypothetical protein